jgi:hypothetical protein
MPNDLSVAVVVPVDPDNALFISSLGAMVWLLSWLLPEPLEKTLGVVLPTSSPEGVTKTDLPEIVVIPPTVEIEFLLLLVFLFTIFQKG